DCGRVLHAVDLDRVVGREAQLAHDLRRQAHTAVTAEGVSDIVIQHAILVDGYGPLPAAGGGEGHLADDQVPPRGGGLERAVCGKSAGPAGVVINRVEA